MFKQLLLTSEGKIPFTQLGVGFLAGAIVAYVYLVYFNKPQRSVQTFVAKPRTIKTPKLPSLKVQQSDPEDDDDVSEIHLPPPSRKPTMMESIFPVTFIGSSSIVRPEQEEGLITDIDDEHPEAIQKVEEEEENDDESEIEE